MTKTLLTIVTLFALITAAHAGNACENLDVKRGQDHDNYIWRVGALQGSCATILGLLASQKISYSTAMMAITQSTRAFMEPKR